MQVPWAWEDIGVLRAIALVLAFLWLIGPLRLALVINWKSVARGYLPARNALYMVLVLLGPVVLGAFPYSRANRHRLLRGECRYTAARVYMSYPSGNRWKWGLEFWVLGKRYTLTRKVAKLSQVLPAGSYWYVRYAVADPDANEGTGRPLPSSVREVPAAGWARLPVVSQPAPAPLPTPPPAPAPVPRIPAAAPEPLTGPAASPVFRPAPARPDSTPRPLIGPLAAPPLPGTAPRR